MNLPQTATVRVDSCRSCHAEILWLKNAKNGKPAPINAKPIPTGGNIRVDLTLGTYDIVPKTERTGPLRTSHFTSCPQMSRWHKKQPATTEETPDASA